MARKRSRTLTQGPFGIPPERGPAGPAPPWWPEWMPWIDMDAWRDIFRRYGEFTTRKRTTEGAGEALTGAGDILEDWYRRAREALEKRSR